MKNNNRDLIPFPMDDLTIVNTTSSLYSYENMVKDLGKLEATYQGKIKVQAIATTKDKRNVYEVIIGNPNNEKHILIHAGIHAREHMTTLLVMKQMEYYLYCFEFGTYHSETYHELFQNITFHILPMVNPDGITISQYGLGKIKSESIKKDIKEWFKRDKTTGVTTKSFESYLKYWKANANGVDLNRNFNYGWDEFVGLSSPGAEKYKGKTVESEPETKALVELTKRIRPIVAISYHATGSIIYWDYGQEGEIRKTCKALVESISKTTGYEIKYAATDKQDAAGYGDWAVMVEQIPSATIEIGIWQAPLSIREFSRIWNENRQIWASLADHYQ